MTQKERSAKAMSFWQERDNPLNERVGLWVLKNGRLFWRSKVDPARNKAVLQPPGFKQSVGYPDRGRDAAIWKSNQELDAAWHAKAGK
jgi:hypothetical protein